MQIIGQTVFVNHSAIFLHVLDLQKKMKIYNSGDSLVVTYLTTNLLVHCLYIVVEGVSIGRKTGVDPQSAVVKEVESY